MQFPNLYSFFIHEYKNINGTFYPVGDLLEWANGKHKTMSASFSENCTNLPDYGNFDVLRIEHGGFLASMIAIRQSDRKMFISEYNTVTWSAWTEYVTNSDISSTRKLLKEVLETPIERKNIAEIIYQVDSGEYIVSSSPETFIENVDFPMELPPTGLIITWHRTDVLDKTYGTLKIRDLTNPASEIYECSIYNNDSYTTWQKVITNSDFTSTQVGILEEGEWDRFEFHFRKSYNVVQLTVIVTPTNYVNVTTRFAFIGEQDYRPLTPTFINFIDCYNNHEVTCCFIDIDGTIRTVEKKGLVGKHLYYATVTYIVK